MQPFFVPYVVKRTTYLLMTPMNYYVRCVLPRSMPFWLHEVTTWLRAGKMAAKPSDKCFKGTVIAFLNMHNFHDNIIYKACMFSLPFPWALVALMQSCCTTLCIWQMICSPLIHKKWRLLQYPEISLLPSWSPELPCSMHHDTPWVGSSCPSHHPPQSN